MLRNGQRTSGGAPGAPLPPAAQVRLQATLGKEPAHHVLRVTLRTLFLLEASAFRPKSFTVQRHEYLKVEFPRPGRLTKSIL